MAQQVYNAITPSDVTVYAPAITSIWVGGTGNIAIVGKGDTAAVTLTAVPVGLLPLPYPVQQVKATGTTATNLVGAMAG